MLLLALALSLSADVSEVLTTTDSVSEAASINIVEVETVTVSCATFEVRGVGVSASEQLTTEDSASEGLALNANIREVFDTFDDVFSHGPHLWISDLVRHARAVLVWDNELPNGYPYPGPTLNIVCPGREGMSIVHGSVQIDFDLVLGQMRVININPPPVNFVCP